MLYGEVDNALAPLAPPGAHRRSEAKATHGKGSNRTSGVESQIAILAAASAQTIFRPGWPNANDGGQRSEHLSRGGELWRWEPCFDLFWRARCARSLSFSRQLSLRLQSPWPACWRSIPILRGPAGLCVPLPPLMSLR